MLSGWGRAQEKIDISQTVYHTRVTNPSRGDSSAEMAEGRNIVRVDFLGSFPKNLPRTGLPEIAFAGRSNVGKSSAINTLLNRKKAARVSSTPGRTQLINLFKIDDRLCFADLPGYGFARVPSSVKMRWKLSLIHI